MYSPELLLIPMSWLALIAFGFGVIIGSFLNVYIYRFHTGKSLAGHSHCLSCGTRLRWYELFPLVSYVVLRGRCRTCGCKIPARYFLVELTTGILFALTILLSLDIFSILLLWFIFGVLVVITVYDLYHFIIPDRLVLVLTVAVVLFTTYQVWIGSVPWSQVGRIVASALGGSFFFLVLWVISKGKWIGFGDVKLAFPLGVLVGSQYVFSFVVLSFWIGAGISLFLLTYSHLSRGKADLHLPGKALTMKSAVPFAPFLIASSLVIVFTHFNVLQLFSFY
ncbi:prepilin peptidase [Candidatus Parcubacteria bacterium]|nr:prepilin peptidase [Candidatus Parcubacteria bacterium]